MTAYKSFSSKLVALPKSDIDTDQIIPARFLKVIDKVGLGKNLFSDWRYQEDGTDNPDFVLNRPSMAGRKILLAGDNFGCGSSREHAPWALVDWGFRAIISTSFADIFSNNALKNSLLPIVVDAETHAALVADSEGNVSVDLEHQSLKLPDGTAVPFPIAPFAKRCLLEGIDQLGYILSFEDDIAKHEDAQ